MKNAKYIKDHVFFFGKAISKATEQKFGINRSLIVKAALGDEQSWLSWGFHVKCICKYILFYGLTFRYLIAFAIRDR